MEYPPGNNVAAWVRNISSHELITIEILTNRKTAVKQVQVGLYVVVTS